MKRSCFVFLLTILSLVGKQAHSQTRKEIHSIHRNAFQLSKTYPDSSLNLLAKAKFKSSAIHYDWGIAFTDYLIARTHMLNKDDVLAIQYFSQAQNGFADADTIDYYNEYVMFWNMARISYRNRTFDLADEFYENSKDRITKFIKSKPQGDLALSALDKLNNIKYFQALSLKKQGEIVKATDLLIDLLESENSISKKMRAKNQIGLIFKDIKNYKKAKQYFLDILSSNEATDYYKALANHNLGYMLLTQQKLLSSAEYFDRAILICNNLININDTNPVRRQLFISHLDLGEVYFQQALYTKAIAQWNTALQVYGDLKGRPDFYIIHNWLLRAYLELGQDLHKVKEHNEFFLNYSREFLQTREQLADALSQSLFSSQLARYEEAQVQAQQQAATRTIFSTYMVVTVLLAIMAIGFIVWYFVFKRGDALYKGMLEIAKKARTNG